MFDQMPLPAGCMRVRICPCERRNPAAYLDRFPRRLRRATVDTWIWQDGQFIFLLKIDPDDPTAVADRDELAKLLGLILSADY